MKYSNPNTDTEKFCNKCSQYKLFDCFRIDNSREDGLRYACKNCLRSQDKLRTQNPSTKQLLKKNQENWKRKNPQYYKNYKKDNKDKNRAHIAKRRAVELQATPKWVDYTEINKLYQKAYELECLDGVKRHIDHIHPLQGKLICGFHVAENLQILTAAENLSKGSIFIPYVMSDIR